LGQSHKAVKNSAIVFEKGPKLTMKRDIVEHLRLFSGGPGKGKTWVAQLDDSQLFELYLKIRSGESARGIARHVQKVWKIGCNPSIHSISQGILKFKQRISHLLLVAPSSDAEEVSVSGFPLGPEEDSTLEAMEDIAKKCEMRITTMLVEEKETGVKYPFLNRDLQALAALQKAILKQMEWERNHKDLLNQKKYERMTKTMDMRFNNLLENLGQNGQDRLLKSINKFLELVEQKTLTTYRKEDGTYTLTNPEEKPKESTSK
jgi:hypothetical protein